MLQDLHQDVVDLVDVRSVAAEGGLVCGELNDEVANEVFDALALLRWARSLLFSLLKLRSVVSLPV
jgi:hypothetical protein